MEIGYNEEAAHVGADQVEPYRAGIDEEAWFRPRQPAPEPTPRPTPEPTPGPSVPRNVPMPEQLPTIIPEDPPPEPAPEPEPPPPEPQAEATVPPPQAVSFIPFSEYDRMMWPIYGETVMPFSVTSLIYDPTLDQFRTNDNLRIAGELGDPVRAGADGKVITTGRNARQGNYITIDHGNGWVATYGQLLDAILVAAGDIVHTGQIIGGIGTPSIFGTANGNHLQLQIKRDEVAVNPYYVLVERGGY